MFKYGLTMLLATMLTTAGCVPASPTPPDPVQPEKTAPYNVTLDKMRADLVGRWIILDNNKRYTFEASDKIALGEVDQDVVDDRTVVTVVKIVVNGDSPQFLDGYLKLRYEMVDGNWFMTQTAVYARLGWCRK